MLPTAGVVRTDDRDAGPRRQLLEVGIADHRQAPGDRHQRLLRLGIEDLAGCLMSRRPRGQVAGSSPLWSHRAKGLEDPPVLECFHTVHGQAQEGGRAAVGQSVHQGIESLGLAWPQRKASAGCCSSLPQLPSQAGDRHWRLVQRGYRGAVRNTPSRQERGLERETGFEPATSTLARLRSTE